MGLNLENLTEEQIAKELHTPLRHKFPRRKVIVHHIDEIWACDLMDFSKEKLEDAIVVKHVRYNYVLVIVDCFSKYCWCSALSIMVLCCIKHKTPEEIISWYKQVFNDRGKPEYLWWDQERAIDSQKFKEFLDSEGVKMYQTFSEIKVSVAERMIRTLKEKCERIKTECELSQKKYHLVEVLPKVLEEYNLRTVH